jgi:predicted AAA+ superfamily ATPase
MNLSESLPSNMNFFSSSNSSSDGTGGASGIGGWLSSLQEKSKTLVEVYKRDLGNFSVDMERNTQIHITHFVDIPKDRPSSI